MMSIDIIGAGISGLTMAIALEKKGYKPIIYEQAKALKPLGAGIMLAPNAMLVYKKLGLENIIKSEGIPLQSLNINDAKLKLLSRVNMSYFKSKYDLQTIAIHRGKLQQILLDQLHGTEIFFDHKVETMTRHGEEYILGFKNGKTIKSALLIGADGIHSNIRKHLKPDSIIRDSNQVCWRGVTQFSLPDRFRSELNEAWGTGDRFAFVEYAKNNIYWYAVKSYHNNKNEFNVEQLDSYFNKYAPIIKEIIKATPLENIHTSLLQDIKPMHSWHDDIACLIGDAAHATTPNMGQGACQAIVDALIISECLEKHPIKEAFSEYQKRRIKTAHNVVNQSWSTGKISHWKNPFAIYLRNKIITLIPNKIMIKQLDNLLDIG